MKHLPLTLIAVAALSTAAFAEKPVDNTANNAKDKDGQTQTPGDQSNSPADIKTTADIRKMIVDDDSISVTGKNVKIITVEQVVTLRGPVESQAEAAKIVEHANHTKPAKVVNELEVK